MKCKTCKRPIKPKQGQVAEYDHRLGFTVRGIVMGEAYEGESVRLMLSDTERYVKMFGRSYVTVLKDKVRLVRP